MRVGVLIRCYHLTKYLKAVLKQYDWADRIHLMNYRFKGVEECEDDTPEIASQFPNTELEHGEVEEQHTIFNKGLSQMRNCDVVFISDADEFFLRSDMDKLVKLCTDHEFVMSRIVDYTDFQTALPIRDHRPVVIVNPKVCKFSEVRNMGGNSYTSNDIFMHHFGYAWKDKDLDWKYRNKWYECFNSMLELPRIQCACPDEIRELIERNTNGETPDKPVQRPAY